jgi:hypothetical protein
MRASLDAILFQKSRVALSCVKSNSIGSRWTEKAVLEVLMIVVPGKPLEHKDNEVISSCISHIVLLG